MYLDVGVPRSLDGVVAGLAGYDESSPVPVRREEVPTGSCTLIVGLDGPAFLAGMHDVAVTTEFVGRQRGVQVDLSPLGVLRLLGRPLYDLTARMVALHELGDPDLAALPERLSRSADWPQRIDDVAATLARRLQTSTTAPDPEVAHVWHRLTHTATPVAALAREVGWSRRHLHTRFRAQIGLAPTAAARVLRFRRATQALVPGRGPVRVPDEVRIADVAAASGYSDHSHLVRDFRAIAGCTPSDYLARWRFPDVQDARGAGS